MRAKMAAERRNNAGAGDRSDDEDDADVALRALDFAPGAEVEVRRNEGGLGSAWYEAAVLRRLPARQRYDVVYVSHVSEKAPSRRRLRERVNCNYVRPRPPPVVDRQGSQYRLHDRVEALFKDGWWSGMISGVLPLPANDRYTVCFPTRREEMEFCHSDLRPQLHWNSDQRRWIPVEEMLSDKPMFNAGDQVEVSSEVKDYGAAWFTAIVVKVFDVNTYFVEYQKSKKKDNKGELIKEILDVQHMRPMLPAEPRVMDFAVGVKVEVLVHGGWSPGMVLAAFGMGKHVVKLTNCVRNSLYQYESSAMRHQRIWNGSRWVHTNKNSKDVDGVHSPAKKQKTSANCNAPALLSASRDLEFVHDEQNPQRLQDVAGVKSSTTKQKADANPIAQASLSASEDMDIEHYTKNPQKLQDLSGVKSSTRKQKGDADHIAQASLTVSEDMEIEHYTKSPPKLQDADGDKSPTKKQKTDASCNPVSLSSSDELKVLQHNKNPEELQDVDGVKSPTMKQKADTNCIATASCSSSGDMPQDECVHRMDQSVKYLTTDGDVNPSSCIAPASCSVSGNMPQSVKNLTTGDGNSSDCISPCSQKKSCIALASCSVSGNTPQDGCVDDLTTVGDANPSRCIAPTYCSVSGNVPQDEYVDHMSQSVTHLTTVGDAIPSSCIAPVSCLVSGSTPQDEHVVHMSQSVTHLTPVGDANPSNCRSPASCSVSGDMPRNECADDTSQSAKHLTTACDANLSTNSTSQYGKNLTTVGDANPSSCIPPASCSVSGDMQGKCDNGTGESVKSHDAANISTNCNQVDHMEGACSIPDEEAVVPMRSCDLTDNVGKQISASPCQESITANENPVCTKSPLEVFADRQFVHRSPNDSSLKKVPLPFVKGSLLWETIESMEIFCKIPQDPHFNTLEKHTMYLREGMALGLMSSFASLASSLQKLSIRDAQTEIEARLGALEQLEANGFNVSCLRLRLNELLQIQFSYKENETRKAMLERKMSTMSMVTNEQEELTARFDKAIEGLEQSIADFRGKRDSVMKQNAICNSEIVKLQLEAHEIDEACSVANENFNLRVAAPW